MRLSTPVLGLCVAASAALPALAQNESVIKERQQLMKNNAKAARTASEIIKGSQPFDASVAAGVFQTLNEDAKKFATLFPEDSKTGAKTEAAPAIWEKPDAFKAANDKFIADTQAAIDAKPADLDSFKAAFTKVAANCQGCHQQFRQR